MKYFVLLGAAAMSLSGAAHAQSVFSEFTVGAGFPAQVETVQYDVDVLGANYVGTLSGTYHAGIAGGIEIGMRGVGSKHVSISFSYDYLQANITDVTFNGTRDGLPYSANATRADFNAAGIDFNNQANLLLGNLRYDFVGPTEIIQPFIGVGGGGSFIENSAASAALAATAGFRVPLGRGFYTGARYRYVKVFGYEDQIGIDYKDLNAHLVSFMFGAHL